MSGNEFEFWSNPSVFYSHSHPQMNMAFGHEHQEFPHDAFNGKRLESNEMGLGVDGRCYSDLNSNQNPLPPSKEENPNPSLDHDRMATDMSQPSFPMLFNNFNSALHPPIFPFSFQAAAAAVCAKPPEETAEPTNEPTVFDFDHFRNEPRDNRIQSNVNNEINSLLSNRENERESNGNQAEQPQRQSNEHSPTTSVPNFTTEMNSVSTADLHRTITPFLPLSTNTFHNPEINQNIHLFVNLASQSQPDLHHHHQQLRDHHDRLQEQHRLQEQERLRQQQHLQQPHFTVPTLTNNDPGLYHNYKEEVKPKKEAPVLCSPGPVPKPRFTSQLCRVCNCGPSNGIHFGASSTCAACAAFFRRSVSDNKRYQCKRPQRCALINLAEANGYRKMCRNCRFKKCMEIGMSQDKVQNKRSRRDDSKMEMHSQMQRHSLYNLGSRELSM